MSVGQSTQATRRRVPRAEREALMLDAAEDVFGAAGFASAGMEDIARRSGITKALVYEYFGSKERLYDACMERVRGRLFDSLEEALAALDDPRAQLRTFIDTYFAFLAENRGKRWLLYGETSAGTADAMRVLNAGAIARMLGETTPLDDLGLEVLAHALVGAGEQVGRWWLEQPGDDSGEVADRFERLARALIIGALR